MRSHSEEINQVMWGFRITVCGPLSLWCIGCRMEMLDEARAGPQFEGQFLQKKEEAGRRRNGMRAGFTAGVPHM